MTLNQPLCGVSGYKSRPTVKLVVLNDQNEVLLFNSLLIGGGVEHDETLTAALEREALEEVGVTFTEPVPLGQVEHYRETTMLKYEVHGFMAKLAKQSDPTTTQKDELGKPLEWLNLTDAVELVQSNLKMYTPESNEPRYFNSLTALKFLEQAKVLVKIGQK